MIADWDCRGKVGCHKGLWKEGELVLDNPWKSGPYRACPERSRRGRVISPRSEPAFRPRVPFWNRLPPSQPRLPHPSRFSTGGYSCCWHQKLAPDPISVEESWNRGPRRPRFENPRTVGQPNLLPRTHGSGGPPSRNYAPLNFSFEPFLSI